MKTREEIQNKLELIQLDIKDARLSIRDDPKNDSLRDWLYYLLAKIDALRWVLYE